MPKTLAVLRHAKAAWPEGVPDRDRPLAARGRRDAPAVGRWLRAHGVAPDVALVSGARRTLETYDRLAGELPAPPRRLVSDEVYRAAAVDLLALVRGLPDEVSVGLLVGHNPGVGKLAAALGTAPESLPVFKTSAVAVFDVGPRWPDVSPGDGRLLASAVVRG